MTGRVVQPSEIYLNGNFFKLAPRGVESARVRQFAGSTKPAKITLGDYNLDSHPITSTWLAVNDQRGGIGIDRMDVSKDLDRCWFSQCNLRHRGHLVLPELPVEATGEPSLRMFVANGKNTSAVHLLSIYTIFLSGTAGAVHALDPSAGSYGSSLHTTAGEPREIKAGDINGTLTLVVFCGNDGVDWSANGSSWNTDTAVNIARGCFHNGLLFGIDTNHDTLSATAKPLYFTSNLSSGWTQTQATLPGFLSVHQFFEAFDADGNPALYVSTSNGLWIYDKANDRLIRTAVRVPANRMNGAGACEWRGAVYYSAGQQIYKYIPGDPPVVTVMGPDRDDGLPSAQDGVIVGLVPSQNELLAIVNGTTTYLETDGNRITLLGWDERAWRVLWQSGDIAAHEAAVPIVTDSDSEYRVYFAVCPQAGLSTTVRYIDLPEGITNPSQVEPGATYASGNHIHETPWFDAGGNHQVKTALQVRIDSTHPTSSETVKVEYATNYSESYTTMGTKTASGEETYEFASGAGLEFRAIKFRLTLTRGATTTNTPDVTKLALLFMRSWSDLRAIACEIDISEQYKNKTVLQQRAALDTVIATRTLMDVSWHSEDDSDEPRKMTLVGYQELGETGRSRNGHWLLSFSEAV